ncbi:hypothetical protein, partial [Kaarinaea lacus]
YPVPAIGCKEIVREAPASVNELRFQIIQFVGRSPFRGRDADKPALVYLSITTFKTVNQP